MVRLSVCIQELGDGSKNRRECKNITALHLSVTNLKLSFHADHLLECSETLCISSGTEHGMETSLNFHLSCHFVVRVDLQNWYVNDTEPPEMKDMPFAILSLLRAVVRSVGIAKYCCHGSTTPGCYKHDWLLTGSACLLGYPQTSHIAYILSLYLLLWQVCEINITILNWTLQCNGRRKKMFCIILIYEKKICLLL